MQVTPHQHISTVMQVASEAHANGKPLASRHEDLIRDSWVRCVHEHGLDPTRMQEAIIVPQARLREHKEQMESLLQIARHGLESLYSKVSGLGYVVLLTDARGITVDFLGDLVFEPSLRRAGLYLGADWSEHHAGTCGVGTCISTGRALTVHLDDHFDATHIPLTCTTAPIYDSLGNLSAVLDISQLSSSQPKESQHLALQLVTMYAHDIENAAFLQRHRRDWIVRLASAPQFLEVQPEYLLALDGAGRVIGHNRRAQLGLQGVNHGKLLGSPWESLLNVPFSQIGRYVMAQPMDQRAVMLRGVHRALFLSVTPPPPVPLVVRDAVAAHLPEPLASLSLGDLALDRQIKRAAMLVNSPISLLITGETGSGKEYFAKAIHASSVRKQRPFVAVNCAAIPEALIESELFGHMPGSFSGASAKGKRGLVQEADGGTLFLDEIGDMPLALQARLLRVLSEREVLPVGALKPIPINIRVIAATHAPLEALVRSGKFRDDLYYRLNGAHFSLPPLRERADRGALIGHMLSGRTLTAAALAQLMAHTWPGNLRELRNVLDYASSMRAHGDIDTDDLPQLREASAVQAVAQPRPAPRCDADEQLLQALRAAHWNVSALARELGLSRMTLYRRMKRAGIVPNNRE
ncbi:sigma-54-dependent Fis family transcriptional regulator [Rhodoferax sp. GW822-FHT02A01]|uniref:sigma-54-dependent Fis family transcriptional regulator n=1 Tax=Rhodoferax sp. GW822-FHT02A01 TaxID=3141537 RepID=UPI00315D1040